MQDFKDIVTFIAETMKNQPVINVGTVGSVSNGKSSTVREITGIETQKHSSEKLKNITIKLGYASVKIYKCNNCTPPKCYQIAKSEDMYKICDFCEEKMDLATHISFVDCPGHIEFMATMISGKCVMDTTMLIEAANNKTIPASQTIEHLRALTLGSIPNHMVCLNKCDLVDKETLTKNIIKLREEFKNTILKDSPIIPISASFCINIDILCEYLSKIPIPNKKLEASVKMLIIRSFNVNKPGIDINELIGGVIGGSVIEGILRVGDAIELRPGFCKKINLNNANDKSLTSNWQYKPLKAKVISIQSEKNNLMYAICGGLIGVQLDIDSALSVGDRLVGNILTLENIGFPVFEEITITYNIIDNTMIFLKKGDVVQLNINACNIGGIVTEINDNNIIDIKLNKPISANYKDDVTICHKSHVYGNGYIVSGLLSQFVDNLDLSSQFATEIETKD